ncbi:MAG: TolC family protein [Methylobacter sp.]|uniref:TolC family protein n=1 Tax=Methylobacter sp. TaxID=2051955 RepID=UPI00258D4C45|nr:TolC family protein [Methylobacter sp.]MCL7420950.1 TolC family protein [Methylobacter sp.]
MARLKRRLPGIPTNGRFYALFLTAFVLFLPAHAQAAPPLTEAQTVEKVLQQASVQNWIEGTINEAQSDVEEFSHWDNPTFSYALDAPHLRDQNATEQAYMIKQSVDLSGRRGLRQSAAKLRLQSAAATTQSRLALFKAETRQRFFDVLHQQQRLQAINAWTQRLAELERIIRERTSAGDVSGYDLKRLQREYASATTQQQAEQAALRRSWEQLNALWENHDAAERWKIPKFNLGVGAKTFDATNYSDTALLVNVDVPLPLWSQNDAERMRSHAQVQKADSEYRLAHQKTYGEMRGSWQELTGLLQAVRTFEQQGQAVSDELINIANISYQAGEIGIFELLDAYRERRTYDLDR